MPWTVVTTDGKHCVHKKGGDGKPVGDPLGCHDSIADAQIQIQALYSNESRSRLGDNVRSIGAGRIGGYLVRFTEPNQRDLYGTYFTRNTEFHIETGFPVKGERVLMEHGFTEALRVMPVGIFDFAEMRDAGLWVEAMLNDRQIYKEYLQKLRENGKIQLTDGEIDKKSKIAEYAIRALVETGETQWSSGTLDKRFEVSEEGEILRWPIIEGTITVAPAEPEGTQIQTIRSAMQQLSDIMLNRNEALDRSEKDEEVRAGNDTNQSKRNSMPSQFRFKVPKILRQMLPENTEQQIVAIVQTVAEEMGETIAPQDVEAVVSEVESVIEEEVASPSTMAMDEEEDELKAFGDEEDEEEVKSRSARKRSVRSKLALRQIAKAAVQHYSKQQHKSDSARRRIVDRELESYRRRTPPDQEIELPAYRRSSPRISVSENLRYAHLSAMDMATYYLQMRALLPLPLRHQMSPVSNDFAKHMTAKVDKEIDSGFKDPKDTVAMRSIMPYKADEIDATTIVGQGAEWVGVFQGTRLWEKVREQSEVFATMSSRGMFMQEIPQGHGSVPIPLEDADPIAYSSPEATDLDATGRVEVTANIGFMGTAKATLTPGMIKIAAATSDELEEDSIIPVLPQMTAQMEMKAVETLEQALINGDTAIGASTNINLIDNTPGTGTSRPYYLVVNGLRKYPLVTNTAASRSAGGALTIDDFRKTVGKLSSKVRNRLTELFFLIDSDTHNTALALPEIATEDVRRTNATIESGRLINIYGIDVFTSGFLLLANSAGKIPAAGGTLGQILCVFPRYWAFGWKRQTVTKTQEDILSGVTYVVTSMRFGFLVRGVDAAAETYNVGVNV